MMSGAGSRQRHVARLDASCEQAGGASVVPCFVRVPRNETVLRRFGGYPATMNIGDAATSLQQFVRDHGLAGFEPATQATLLTLVQRAAPEAEFYDVGAHVGVYSSLIATIYPADAVRVTAFEPTPRTAQICRSIAAANQLAMRVERYAVAAQDGTAQLHISPWDTSNSLRDGFRRTDVAVAVPTVSLDRYCAQRGARPSVIKIDVETLESQVLLGALETLERVRPAVVCELLPYADPEATEQALAALVRLGYHIYRWIGGHGWLECTAEDLTRQIFHHGRDWLFTPDRLDRRFHAALDEWLDAIAECTPETSVQIKHDRSRSRPARYELAGRGMVDARLRRTSTALARLPRRS
jgi:FkbM family methyltransferase